MDLFAHGQWVEGFCCALGCCRKEHSQRHPAAAVTSSGVTHPSGLTANEPQAIESVAVFFQHHLSWCSKVPLLLHQGYALPHDQQGSEKAWGRATAGCQNSHAIPRANSSCPQYNCCERKVASRNKLSRGGSRPKNLIFISTIHHGPVRSKLHVQVAQSPSFPGRSPARILSRLFLPHHLSCLC